MNLNILSAGFAATVLLCANTAFAASSTHDLNVSASVSGNCKFNTAGPTALPIANSGAAIDPSVATDATGSATVAFRCTKGTASAISADDGQNFSGSRRVKLDATNFMPYALSLSGDVQTGTGHGAGQDMTLTVNATIATADHQNATAGAYTDTVVLTITP